MARIMEQALVALTTGAWADAFTVPSGKKFEVLQICCNEYLGIASKFAVAEQYPAIPFYNYLDEFALAAGALAVARSYNALLIPAGRKLSISKTAAAAGSSLAYVVYMNVDV